MERLQSACFLPYDILESIKTVQMVKKVTGSHGLGKVSELKVAQSCLTLCNPMGCSLSGSFVHGDFPGKNTRLGCHFLFQGIFPPRD